MERNISRSFISILGSTIMLLLLGFVITPLLVRFLGSTGYGEFAFLMSIVGLLSPLMFSGILNGLRKYIAESRSEQDWECIVFSVYSALAIGVCTLVAVLVALLIVTDQVTSFFQPRFRVYFLLLILYLYVRALQVIGRATLMGFGLEQFSEPARVLNKILFGVITLSLVAQGWGVEGAIVGKIGAVLASAAVMLYFVHRETVIQNPIWFVADGINRVEFYRFGVYSVLLGFLTVSMYHVDIVLIRSFTNADQTGYYKAALVLAQFLWFVPTAIQYTLVQSISELWSEGRHEYVSEIAATVTRYSAVLLGIMIVGLAALAHVFVPLYYGPEFRPAIKPFLLLLPGSLGFALARPIFSISQGIGRLKIIVAATGAAAALNFLLNIILIPRYGIQGAAIATSLGYGSMFLLHVWAARRVGFDPVSDLRWKRIVAALGGASIPVFGVTSLLPPSIVALLVVPPIGACVYAVLSLRIGVITPQEADDILERMPDQAAHVGKRFVRLVV